MSRFPLIFRCVVKSLLSPCSPFPWLPGWSGTLGAWSGTLGCHRVPCPNTGRSHLLNVIVCGKAKHQSGRKYIQHLKKKKTKPKPSEFMWQIPQIYRNGFAACAFFWKHTKVFVRVLAPLWCGSGWAWLAFSIPLRYGLYSLATIMKSILEIAYT